MSRLLLFLLFFPCLAAMGVPNSFSKQAEQAMAASEPGQAWALLDSALSKAGGAADSVQLYYEWGKNFWLCKETTITDLSFAERALKAAVGLRQDTLEKSTMAHFILGMLYSRQRDHHQSRKHYELVLEQSEALGAIKPMVLAKTYHFLGKHYTRLGDFPRALSLFQASLNQGFSSMTPVNYLESGTAYLYLRDYRQAEARYLAAIATGGLGVDEKAVACDKLAEVCMVQGRFEEALAHGKAAWEFSRKAKNQRFEASSLKTLGDICLRMGSLELAGLHYKQSLQVAADAYPNPFNRETAKIYLALGGWELESGRAEAALAAYQEALRCVLGGKTSRDPRFHLEASAFYPENVIMEALEGKALAFSRLAEPLKAMENYRLLAHIEDLLRLSFDFDESKYLLVDESHRRTGAALDLAYELYEQSHEAGYLEWAFELAERSKAMVLLESMKHREALEAARLPDSLRMQEQELMMEISNLESLLRQEEGDPEQIRAQQEQLFSLRQTQNQLEQYLEKNFPAYHSVKYDLRVASLQEVQSGLLEQNQVMIEYFTGDRFLYAFVIDRKKAVWKRFSKPSGWDARLQAFLQGLSSGEASFEASYPAEAHALYQELLAPLDLPGRCRLIVIPDGLLGLLPFEALLSAEAKPGASYRNYPYLLFTHELSYAYSATLLAGTLARSTRRHASASCFLALAPGTFDLPGLAPLPRTQEEVQRLQALLGGKAFIGAEATKARFLEEAANCEVLHLSTHALGWDSIRGTAWIAFAGETPSEALLTLEELYGLHLQAELTVLSACETGSGALQRGEGVLSLARGFTYAGSQSIVKTLWPVNPVVSQRLLESFYGHLSDGLSKDRALHRAKVEFLQAADLPPFLAQPGRWAAFVAIGDMRPLQGSRPMWPLWVAIGLGLVGLVWAGRKKWVAFIPGTAPGPRP